MQQKNDYDCGVFACQFAYGMIRLINTNVIKQSSRIKDIKRSFEELCSKLQKGALKRTRAVYAKTIPRICALLLLQFIVSYDVLDVFK